MRHAVVKTALALAVVGASQVALADTASPAPVTLAVAGAAADPASAFLPVASPPQLIGSRIVGGAANAKGGKVSFAASPSAATIAWAVGGQSKSVVVGVGRTTAMTFANAIGELTMPPVGGGAPTMPITVGFFSSNVTTSTTANNAQVSALPAGKNLDTGRVRATFVGINGPVTSVMAIDSAEGSTSIAVTGAVSPTPTTMNAGQVTYFSVDGAELMTLKLSGGAVTRVIPPIPPATNFTVISFKTSVSL